jgi:polyhydroxybutyrate depolymerase
MSHLKSALSKTGLIGLLACSLFGVQTTAHACGPDTDCVLENDRHYRIRMPEGHDGSTKIGAIFFMHGYKGSAKGVMSNKNLGKAVSDLGLALVAPKSAHDDWAIPGAPSAKEPVELEYFEAVVADIEKRFAIDTSRMMASGFSAGGMMTWNLACDKSELFAAYAPIAGTFWEPIPKTCKAPTTSIIHTHGLSDKIVPLFGREIGSAKQGNVPEVMEMYSQKGKFRNAGDTMNTTLELECTKLLNAENQSLDLCLHPGEHSMKTDYVVNAWKKFSNRGIIKR